MLLLFRRRFDHLDSPPSPGKRRRALTSTFLSSVQQTCGRSGGLLEEGGGGGGVVGRQESGPRIAGGIRKKTKPPPQRRTDGGRDLAYCSRKRAGKGRNGGRGCRGVSGRGSLPHSTPPNSQRVLQGFSYSGRGHMVLTWDIRAELILQTSLFVRNPTRASAD